MDRQREQISRLERRLEGIDPDLRHRDEIAALHACELGLQALKAGSEGVGALVLDAEHRVLVAAQDNTRGDGQDSGGHAAMRAIDRLERLAGNCPPVADLTLLVTRESCPMCLSRVLYAGIGELVHIAPDGAAGMVHLRDQLPPALRDRARRVRYRLADVSEPLRALARELADARMAPAQV